MLVEEGVLGFRVLNLILSFEITACGETGHNARTCQDTIVVLGLSDSE